jgi:ABC-2 type transport system ATP-binding protein/ribosome-dependent ATPase
VGELSLGLQRRLAFVIALDHRPELLVLDEPTSGVGPLAAARLWETIRDATDAGAGAVVTTHNLEEAEQCDRLIVMAAGRVVTEGTLRSIVGNARSVVITTEDWTVPFATLQRAGIPSALVGDAIRVGGSSLIEVRAALGNLPGRVEEVPATLEERFAQLVTPGEGSLSVSPAPGTAAGTAAAARPSSTR